MIQYLHRCLPCSASTMSCHCFLIVCPLPETERGPTTISNVQRIRIHGPLREWLIVCVILPISFNRNKLSVIWSNCPFISDEVTWQSRESKQVADLHGTVWPRMKWPCFFFPTFSGVRWWWSWSVIGRVFAASLDAVQMERVVWNEFPIILPCNAW